MSALALAAGCKRSARVVPVSGTVFYNDKPLPYGSILFQPEKGQLAVGEIRDDGTFSLSSFSPGDGAVPGRHSVSISCYEGQRPDPSKSDNPEVPASMGRLLIPVKYTRLGSSGLTAEIKDEPNQTVEFRLTGPAAKF